MFFFLESHSWQTLKTSPYTSKISSSSPNFSFQSKSSTLQTHTLLRTVTINTHPLMTNFAFQGLIFSRRLTLTIWGDAALTRRSPPTVQSSAWETSCDGLATNFRTWVHLFVSPLTLFVLSQRNCDYGSSIKDGLYWWISDGLQGEKLLWQMMFFSFFGSEWGGRIE